MKREKLNYLPEPHASYEEVIAYVKDVLEVDDLPVLDVEKIGVRGWRIYLKPRKRTKVITVIEVDPVALRIVSKHKSGWMIIYSHLPSMIIITRISETGRIASRHQIYLQPMEVRL